MRETIWYLGNDPVIPVHVLGEYPTLVRGKEITVNLLFEAGDYSALGTTGGTAGGATGFTAGGATGATAGTKQFIRDHPAGYLEARKQLDFAGAAAWGVDIYQIPWLHEMIPPRDPVDSHVVPIRPGANTDEARGFWGLIVGGSEGTALVDEFAALELSMVVLAAYDDYGSRDELLADLSPEILP